MTKSPRLPRHRAGAFELVYKKWALPLTKFIIKRVGGDQEAVEEVFSRTIEAAWKGWHTFKHKSSYFTWLCRIALNKAADYYREEVNRRSGIISPLLENLADFKAGNPSPEEALALKELRQSVKDCLNLLPASKKRLLYLRYWKELTHREIAKLLGISERAVEGRLYRARHELAEVLNSRNLVPNNS